MHAVTASLLFSYSPFKWAQMLWVQTQVMWPLRCHRVPGYLMVRWQARFGGGGGVELSTGNASVPSASTFCRLGPRGLHGAKRMYHLFPPHAYTPSPCSLFFLSLNWPLRLDDHVGKCEKLRCSFDVCCGVVVPLGGAYWRWAGAPWRCSAPLRLLLPSCSLCRLPLPIWRHSGPLFALVDLVSGSAHGQVGGDHLPPFSSLPLYHCPCPPTRPFDLRETYVANHTPPHPTYPLKSTPVTNLFPDSLGTWTQLF